MATMYDGSARLPDGTYVRVTERTCEETGPARAFVGRIVGTDIGRTKYEVGGRYGGWGKWLFLKGGCWAFPGEVEEISEAEALAAPSEA